MLFNSLSFLVFFPVVTGLYFALPHRFRWLLLLLASCVFYMAFIPAYILILAVTILIDYSAGIMIEKTVGRRRKVFLAGSIISTCLVLFIFKYFNFFNGNFAALARFLDWNYPIPALQIILPIGLSFHTFQSLSYVIEVYRGRQKTEKNFGIYSLYVMFYPQLVAGPIERPQNLLHQFYEPHTFDYQRVTGGLKLMAWGMFKKVVVADRFAVFVNQAYNHAEDSSGVSLAAATLFFAFQIFCDFSGYSDIALGAAQVMGFKLMTNFDRPYRAQSVSEFWKRWHISLSSWFRDYLYISLGGNRVSAARRYFNLFFTFLVSGLWHGANWTYVIWGALNGAYLIIGRLTQALQAWAGKVTGLDKLPRVHGLLQVSLTFFLTCVAWIFFRARNLPQAFLILRKSLGGLAEVISLPLTWFRGGDVSPVAAGVLIGQPRHELWVGLAAVAVLVLVHHWQNRGSVRQMVAARPAWFRWSLYFGLVAAILFGGAFTSSTQFIYFQF